MRLRSLIHLLEAAQSLVHPERIVVLGSSSLLPIEPSLGEAGQPLEVSYDADLLISPIDEERARILMESLGQESFFAKAHGYYADIMREEITGTLPRGWSSRLETVPERPGCFCLNRHDVALVKLILGRPKDLRLIEELLKRGILHPQSLREHYQSSELSDDDAAKAGRNLHVMLSAK